MEEKDRLQKLAGIKQIPFAISHIDEYMFKTGLPITIPFRKISNKKGTSKDAIDTFQQSIEPTGNYISFDKNQSIKGDQNNQVSYGIITFNNPLVIKFNSGEEETYDSNSWKSILANYYGKKGRSLSKKIKDNGYDAIITVYDDGNIAEIVDLTTFI